MYAHIIDGKINGCGQCRILGDNIQNIVITDEIASELDKYIFQDGEIILNPNYEQEQAQKEHERIMELSMTRSDFFDGTIKAFGADSDDLLVAVQAVIGKSDLSDIEKKVAVNNYKNALNNQEDTSAFFSMWEKLSTEGDILEIIGVPQELK